MKEEYSLMKLITPSFVILQEKIGKEIKRIFSGKEKINVVDLGCGTGFTSEEILKRNPNAFVIGVDKDLFLLRQAKIVLNKWVKVGKVELIEKDILNYLKDIPDESKDVFVSAFTIHNFKKSYRQKVLKQIFRSLKKGGFFINSDKYNSDNKKQNKLWSEYHCNFQMQKLTIIDKSELTSEWKKHHLKDNAPDLVQLEKESIEKMKKIGFENINLIYRDNLVATLISNKPKY